MGDTIDLEERPNHHSIEISVDITIIKQHHVLPLLRLFENGTIPHTSTGPPVNMTPASPRTG